MIQPTIFLGLVPNIDSNQDYKEKISSYLAECSNYSYVLACIPFSNQLRNESICLYFASKQSKTFLISQLKPYLEEQGIETETDDFSKASNHNYYLTYCKELFGETPVIFMTLRENRQVSLHIGNLLQQMRYKDVLLVGLGNLTHTQINDSQAENDRAAKDFDSWVRVKLIEFDYYGLRDFENFLDYKFDDIRYYLPFLFIYGTFFGTDEIKDLYLGFDGDTSLRSLAYQHVPLPGDRKHG